MSDTIHKTKVFMNGRSQAARIPAEYRFDEEEVFINKVGDTLMITPVSALKEAFELGSATLPDDFMEDGLPEQIPAVREDL